MGFSYQGDKKWQKMRKEYKIYKTLEYSDKPKFYTLDMFPYPSGAGIHVGHPKGFVATDVIARQKMLQGYNVLHPMGRDAFGLPAEQYAIKMKVNPKILTDQNVKRFKKQLENIGFTYDRDREANTTDPDFYKWTQWTFIKMYEHYYDQKEKKARPISYIRGQIDNYISNREYEKSYGIEIFDKFLKADSLTVADVDEVIINNFLDSIRLAYVDFKPILWSVELKTAISQEDLDENGNCERTGGPVERRPMRQRVIRMTDYAERMLEGLDELKERPENIKEMQINRIGKTEGTQFDMEIVSGDESNNNNKYNISIYTTRIDTVYGMSYVAIAPEHPIAEQITSKENSKAVKEYIANAKLKGELQRTDLNKDKTGVFTGAYAINPFNGEKVPVWIADYVLGGYGTGAVMAVPAHDERDWEFAKKYDLKSKHVVGKSFGIKHKDSESKLSGYAIIYDKKNKKIIAGKDGELLRLPGGTIEKGETILDGTVREIEEETGYTDISFEGEICCAQSFYYADKKAIWRENNKKILLFSLDSDNRIEKKLTEFENDCEILKVSLDELKDNNQRINNKDKQNGWKDCWGFVFDMIEKYLEGKGSFTEKGTLIDSGKWTGMKSDEAIKSMQEWLEKKGIGGKKVQYKLQDRVFSRQRYRGEPIPMIHTSKGIKPMEESELPLVLPDVEYYEPTGTEEGPLANIEERINVPEGKMESNTMPQRAGSSRYWLRYMDPRNNKNLVDPKIEKYRGQVDMYIGGMEHATRHLIYARFWHKFLYDIGVVSTSEPFKKVCGVGLVMAEDGRKMSKRRGNVINPDDVIAEYGADAFRTYEMFMGPFENEIARSTAGVKGVKKFLDKIMRLADKLDDNNNISNQNKAILHKTIKKVTEDIENIKFNTAISQLMILVNSLNEEKSIDASTLEILTLLISPFAPHLAESLWEYLGNEFSIFTKGKWPSFDPELIKDETIKMAVQFNGKTRGTIQISTNASEEQVMEIVRSDEKLASRMTSEPKKIIYVPGKILNIVS